MSQIGRNASLKCAHAQCRPLSVSRGLQLTAAMEVVITSLDALLHKATNANLQRPDPAAVEAFCAVLADSPNGSYIATRVIASRIRSQHPTEALLALEVLDSCMKRCDSAFHSEVDKFRFLNEMIKLVSPKYYGNRTAPAVKQKVLTLMHSWTVDYPREIKIRDAYEMLKKQGVVKDSPPPPPVEEGTITVPKSRSKDPIFEDEERSKLLQKLLQSKNPDDLQAANRLIKSMVREGERRIEAVTRRVTELQTVQNNAHLLDEMLDQYRPGISSGEDLELIKELFTECSRLRPTLFKLATETQQNEDMLNEILEVSDDLGRIFDKYASIVLLSKTQKLPEQQNSSNLNDNISSLLDLASPSEQVQRVVSNNEASKCKASNLEALGDIFLSVNNSKEVNESFDSNSIPVLKPVTVASFSGKDSANIKTNSQSTNKGLEELNALGEELLKSSLPPSFKQLASFNSQKTEKMSLNSMGKVSMQSPIESFEEKPESSHSSHLLPQSNSNNMLDLDFLISKTLQSENSNSENSLNDDAMVDISSDDALIETKSKTNTDDQDISLIDYLKTMDVKDINAPEASELIIKSTEVIAEVKKSSILKPLTDINIDLENIKSSSKPPLTIYEEENGLTVVLHFTKNKPRPDVAVFVVSSTSRSICPVRDYKYQAVVPKGFKVRLLEPSANTFPAFSPFLPPAAITQVMLIGHPTAEGQVEIFLKFVINYMFDEETVSEIGDVKFTLNEA